jgi:hypothetical protein
MAGRQHGCVAGADDNDIPDSEQVSWAHQTEDRQDDMCCLEMRRTWVFVANRYPGPGECPQLLKGGGELSRAGRLLMVGH